MKSMTGYGFAELQNENFILSVELKSYNNRFLEIVHTMPSSLSCFEIDLDDRIKEYATRGRVEVNIKLKNLKSSMQITVDTGALEQYRLAIDQIEQSMGRKVVFSFSDLSAVENLITETTQFNPDSYRCDLMKALDLALAQFSATKEREGEATKLDLLRLLDTLNQGFDVVKSNANKLETAIRETMLAKFDEMLGEKGYDETRFLQEVATMLVKYSINEEICRLTAHITEAYRLLNGSQPCGKRMDFLSQEMNREINTIGSKNILVEISQMVVMMKDCLENIREQIRNIE